MTVKPLSGEDRESLQNVIAGRYLRGDCYAMAIALHRRTGWPLIAAYRKGFPWVHAGVRRPDGQAQDVRGPLSDEEFLSDYLADRVDDVTEEQLAAVDPNNLDYRIARAQRFIDDVFPDLPRTDRDDRLQSFLTDLQALCLRHGFHIRAPYPGARPIVYPSYGDEQGYEAERLAVGGWTFDRVL